jgi:hypothetical protein
MNDYTKPEILVVNDLTEGIYASSGSSGGGCESIYMSGVYLKGTYNSINDGYKIGYGCDGCPADFGKCAVQEESEKYDGDFRPSWEKNGKLPDEKGW